MAAATATVSAGESGGASSELAELQMKANQATDEVNIFLLLFFSSKIMIKRLNVAHFFMPWGKYRRVRCILIMNH